MSQDLAVVILAGGEGTRLGGGKPLKRLAGERLIDRALRTARALSDQVAIALRDAVQLEGVNALIIRDEPNVGGPLGGLIAALRFAVRSSREFVLTIPVDSPFLPSDLATRLRSGIGEAGCAIASSGGRMHPICGLWRTSVLNSVESYLAGERRSLKAFAGTVGFAEVDWPSTPFDPFFNINTAEDLAQAELRALG